MVDASKWQNILLKLPYGLWIPIIGDEIGEGWPSGWDNGSGTGWGWRRTGGEVPGLKWCGGGDTEAKDPPISTIKISN